MPRISTAAGWAALVAGVCLGCADRPPVGYVTGKIVHDGKPVPAGHQVCFEMSSQGYLAAGVVQDDGRYTLSYKRSPGIPPGDYVVFVGPPDSGMSEQEFRALQRKVNAEYRSRGEQPPPSPDWVLPVKFYQPSTSPLRETVEPGKNIIDLSLVD